MGVAHSQAKRPFFSLDERVTLAREVLEPYKNVTVHGLLGPAVGIREGAERHA